MAHAALAAEENKMRGHELNRTGNESRSIKQIAYHEAGHAVFFYLLRVRLDKCTIIPAGDTLGTASPTDAREIVRRLNTGHLKRKLAESMIMILLAGSLAEAKFRKKRRPSLPLPGSEDDYNTAHRIAGNRCGDIVEQEAYVRRLTAAAANILALRWTMVKTIAKELVAQKTLSGRRVRQICRQLGPIVYEL